MEASKLAKTINVYSFVFGVFATIQFLVDFNIFGSILALLLLIFNYYLLAETKKVTLPKKSLFVTLIVFYVLFAIIGTITPAFCFMIVLFSIIGVGLSVVYLIKSSN